MVAVTEAGPVVPSGVALPSTDGSPLESRRVVAIAVTATELLRPGSDLARTIDGAGLVDLLLACEDGPVAAPSAVGVLGAAAPPELDDADAGDADEDDEDDEGEDEDEDDLRAATDRLGLADLHLHRLALSAPLTGAAEPDLVAALSELVGFDPEPGVQVLAPAALPADPQRSVVDRAVRRIVEVYGLPLQRYRCLEFSVVDDADDG